MRVKAKVTDGKLNQIIEDERTGWLAEMARELLAYRNPEAISQTTLFYRGFKYVRLDENVIEMLNHYAAESGEGNTTPSDVIRSIDVLWESSTEVAHQRLKQIEALERHLWAKERVIRKLKSEL